MYRGTAQIDGEDVLEAIVETVEQAPREMRREAGLVARGATAQQIVAELSKEPGPSRRPVLWESRRQQRYVMGLLRRSGRLPFSRSHKISRGWRVGLNTLASAGENGGVISIENSERGVEWVSGEFQTRQNAATGWPLARLVIRNNEAALTDELITAWYRVSTRVRK